MAGNKRTNNTQLPGHFELTKILAQEQFRPVAAGKESEHYPEFGSIVALLKAAELPTAVFTDNIKTIQEAVAQADALLEQCVGTLLTLGGDDNFIKMFDAAYDYLSEADDVSPSDLIFVFGGKTIARIETAVDLYEQKYAPKIFLSGGSPIYGTTNNGSEAAVYRDYAVAAGVPNEAILVEQTSITVPDNIRASLNMLEAMGEQPQSLILVNSPYVQRRGWCIFKKHLPDTVKLYRVNCSTKPEYSRSEWFKQEPTMRIVLNEFMKMRASVIYNTA